MCRCGSTGTMDSVASIVGSNSESNSRTEEKQNGTAVVINPGGGYNILALTLEGIEIAEWFNSIGVTAIVLQYRVPRAQPPLAKMVTMGQAACKSDPARGMSANVGQV